MVYHVLYRGVGKQKLFHKNEDYLAFERVIVETLEKRPMRILSYGLMPNHWPFVLWPENDGELGAFMQRLTVTHVTRWQKHYNMVGYGHVCQGRYKSFPVKTDDYFFQVMRSVERIALRANLVSKAENWQFGSSWIRQFGTAKDKAMLLKWPIALPRKRADFVSEPASEQELEALRRSCVRGTPYGDDDWMKETANQLGQKSTLRRPGRPQKRQTGPVPVSATI